MEIKVNQRIELPKLFPTVPAKRFVLLFSELIKVKFYRYFGFKVDREIPSTK